MEVILYNESFNAPFALLAVGGLILPALGRYLMIWYFEFLTWWKRL